MERDYTLGANIIHGPEAQRNIVTAQAKDLVQHLESYTNDNGWTLKDEGERGRRILEIQTQLANLVRQQTQTTKGESNDF